MAQLRLAVARADNLGCPATARARPAGRGGRLAHPAAFPDSVGAGAAHLGLVHRGLRPLSRFAQALKALARIARSGAGACRASGSRAADRRAERLAGAHAGGASHAARLVADAAHELRSPLAPRCSCNCSSLNVPNRRRRASRRSPNLRLVWSGRRTPCSRCSPWRLEPGAAERVRAPVLAGRPHPRRGARTGAVGRGARHRPRAGGGGCRRRCCRRCRGAAHPARQPRRQRPALHAFRRTGRRGLRDGGRQACLEVMHSGPGIPPAERERVFDRFYRGVASGEGGRRGGSGLGLKIVRAIAERMARTSSWTRPASAACGYG